MLTLYSYPGLFGVPDNNGYGLKVFAFLKLAGVPFRHEHLFGAQEVWIDARQLKGGDPLESEIKAAIEQAAGMAVLVNPDAHESEWVAKELKHGLQVQAERGLAAFPVILMALNGTKPSSLAGYFDEQPIHIPVSSSPGGATAASHDILVALGLRLPTDRAPVAQPRPEPVEELVLKFSDLRFLEHDGKRRAAANAKLI